MKCQICDEEMTLFLDAKYNRTGLVDFPFKELQCPSCGLLATSPPPNNEIYLGSIGTSGNEEIQHQDINDQNAPHWYLRLIKRLIREKPKGHILDLGANSGDFMVLAQKHGYEVTAVEIDEKAVEAGTKLGRNILQGDAFKMEFPEKFDCIVMNHVLEHIPDLKDVSKNLARLLKDDGVIIMNVPYYKGLFPKLMKENWGLWTPNTHVTFFTKESVYRMFHSNFKDIKLTSNTTCEPLGEFSIFQPKGFIKNLLAILAESTSMGDELGITLRKHILN